MRDKVIHVMRMYWPEVRDDLFKLYELDVIDKHEVRETMLDFVMGILDDDSFEWFHKQSYEDKVAMAAEAFPNDEVNPNVV